jgi:hypothetical protein
MTPNELADELEAFYVDPDGFPYMISEAVTVLRQFNLAESIIKQQQLEIEALKDEVAKWKMSYENSIRFEDGYGYN